MENVYPLNPKQLGTYQKRPQPANHFTQSAGKDLITPQTWRKTGKREKCGLALPDPDFPSSRRVGPRTAVATAASVAG